MLPLLGWAALGAASLLGLAALGDDEDDNKKNHIDDESIQKQMDNEVKENNRAVRSEILNYKKSEILRLEKKYNIHIISQNGNFSFENPTLRILEANKQEIKNQIKQLEELRNALG